MSKKLFLMVSVLLSAGMFSACSNSDEIDSNLSKGDIIKTDEAYDKIQISFSLLNDKNVPTTAFEYGEDICFELTITNNSDKELIIFDDIRLGRDLFRVFQNDCTEVGTPWTSLGSDYVAVGIEPKTSTRLACNWIKAFSTQKPLKKKKEYAPLPIGNYYTNFIIKYRNLDSDLQDAFFEKEFNLNFKIQ